MASGSPPSASWTTATGFPRYGTVVKTSTWRNGRVGMTRSWQSETRGVRLSSRVDQAGRMAVVLYQDAALADGTGPEVQLGISVLVADDRIRWMGAAGDEP